MRLNALELARSQVGNKAHLLAHQVLGVVVLGNSRHDGAPAHAVVNLELQQFVSLRHLGTFNHLAHANVEFHKLLEVDVLSHRSRLEVVDFVLLLDVLKALDLRFYHVILNLFEQQFGLANLSAGSNDVGRAELVPVELGEVNHATKLLGAEWQERFEGNGEVGSDLHS